MTLYVFQLFLTQCLPGLRIPVPSLRVPIPCVRDLDCDPGDRCRIAGFGLCGPLESTDEEHVSDGSIAGELGGLWDNTEE